MVGIDANRSEYKCWKSTKAKFLAKTYFSCVLVNIQEYESGIVPNRKDLWEVLKKIECKHEIWTVNPHCLDIYNFRKNEKGYMLIDYGDDGSGLPFSSFITRWYRDMEKILSF
jgi:hypothetical protein